MAGRAVAAVNGPSAAGITRIFHITTAGELRRGLAEERYQPDRLAEDGFVHCAVDAESIQAVAADYFADLAGPVVVLEIDVALLTSRLVFEAAAPIPGGGTAYLEGAAEFPHVYGPIERAAIVGAGRLDTGAAPGGFRWPRNLEPLDVVLAAFS